MKKLTVYSNEKLNPTFDGGFYLFDVNPKYSCYEYGVDNSIYEAFLKELDEKKIAYTEEGSYETNAVKDFLDDRASASDFRCIKDENGDLHIQQDEEDKAVIYDKDTSVLVKNISLTSDEEQELLKWLCENYKPVDLSAELMSKVNPDTVICLPNGYTEDLAEIKRLDLEIDEDKISKTFTSHVFDVNGVWRVFNDKEYLKYHSEDSIHRASISYVASALRVEPPYKGFFTDLDLYGKPNESYQAKLVVSSKAAIEKSLENVLPYITKAVVKNMDGTFRDVTASLTAPLPENYYMRKFHIEHHYPDGNVYQGFVNCIADSPEELLESNQFKGDYWIERLKAGWIGRFELADGLKADARIYMPDNSNGIVTNGVFPPEPQDRNILVLSTAEAEQILRSASAINLEGKTVPKFAGRLEEAVYSEETHCFSYSREKAERVRYADKDEHIRE